jgi:hypothetical protein
MTKHIYQGQCPDELQPESIDPNCPECNREQQEREFMAGVARELDALHCAPIAMVDTRDALCLCAPTEDAFPALYALQGKFVALVEVRKFSPNLSVMLNNKELP